MSKKKTRRKKVTELLPEESTAIKAIITSSVCLSKYTPKQPLTKEEEMMRQKLGYEPIHIDDLIRQNNMKISETLHIMKSLERKGAVKCIEKSYYILAL